MSFAVETLSEKTILALHRELVEIPSVSHEERAIVDHVEGVLRSAGAAVERIGENIVARTGDGPALLLNSHLDTVPPGEGWTRDPWTMVEVGGRLYGLGSNDAKASAAAMLAAFLDYHAFSNSSDRGAVTLMLVCEEETGGAGTELVWPMLEARGEMPAAVVVGEPTGLDVAIAQKGMLVLELVATGDACHSAHARAIEARNPIEILARDIARLESLDLGPVHPALGGATCAPTVIHAGEARNRVPAEARVIIDLRTVPGEKHAVTLARIHAAVESDVHIISDRLEPFACDPDAPIVEAISLARPGAQHFGSRTMSDLVFFRGVDAVKVGPGKTERSHTADEFVFADEVIEGARFYRRLFETFSESTAKGARR
jgi:acetylornithine deacetylase